MRYIYKVLLITITPQAFIFSLLWVWMYSNMVEEFFQEHAVSIILTFVAITSTIVIAYLFKFKWKSHIERIFEENIDDSLYVIFNHIHSFDSDFSSTIDFIENRMEFKITKKLHGIVRVKPNVVINETGGFTMKPYDEDSKYMKDYAKWFKIKNENIKSFIDSLNYKSECFEENRSYYQNYIHRLILHQLSFYMQNGISFIQWLGPNYIPWYAIENRKKEAKIIIDFCEKHKIPRKGWNKGFLEFKQKWKNYNDDNIL